MTKRDFFLVLIKIFGLYSLVTALFSILPGNISIFLMGNLDVFIVLWIVFIIAIISGLFIILIFRADKIVELLKLDKGFHDDRIEFGNLSSTDIIKIGTFVIGGMMIVNNVPGFLSHTLWALNEKTDVQREFTSKEKFNWAVSGMNLLVGYFLLTNYEFVAKFVKSPIPEK